MLKTRCEARSYQLLGKSCGRCTHLGIRTKKKRFNLREIRVAGQVDLHEPCRPFFRGWPKQLLVVDEGAESVALPNEVVRVFFCLLHLHHAMYVMYITACIYRHTEVSHQVLHRFLRL